MSFCRSNSHRSGQSDSRRLLIGNPPFFYRSLRA
jgi:hypothetical protein